MNTDASGVDLNHLPGIAGGIASMVFLGWLIRNIRPMPSLLPDGRRLLRYHRSYEVIGWLTTVLFLVAFVCSILFAPPKDRTALILIFGGFLAPGMFLIWIARRCVISYTHREVHYVPLFTKPFQFTWTEITSVGFSRINHWWVFHLADGRKARVSVYMNGHEDFIETARRSSNVPIPRNPFQG